MRVEVLQLLQPAYVEGLLQLHAAGYLVLAHGGARMHEVCELHARSTLLIQRQLGARNAGRARPVVLGILGGHMRRRRARRRRHVARVSSAVLPGARTVSLTSRASIHQLVLAQSRKEPAWSTDEGCEQVGRRLVGPRRCLGYGDVGGEKLGWWHVLGRRWHVLGRRWWPSGRWWRRLRPRPRL